MATATKTPKNRQRSKRVASKVGKNAGLSHVAGRPATVTEVLNNQKQREEVAKMIAAGMSNRNISHALGVNGKMMTEWMDRGNADLESGFNSDYARFMLWVESIRNLSRQSALNYLQTNDDWKAREAWLKRTDAEMDYVDRDRIAGRGETNIQVNTGGQQQIRLDSMEMARQNFMKMQERKSLIMGEPAREITGEDNDDEDESSGLDAFGTEEGGPGVGQSEGSAEASDGPRSDTDGDAGDAC